jgi:anti-sigma-K factor RskA
MPWNLERRQFERHHAECPDCVSEVAELRATATRLAVAVAEQPPDRLRHNVFAQVATTRQESPRTATHGRTASSWAVRLAALAAASVLGIAIAAGVIAINTRHQLDSGAQAVFAASDAHSASAEGLAGGMAIVTMSHQLNRAVLVVSDLPTLPAGQAYQAWLLGHGDPRSIGMVTTGPALVFQVDNGTKVGITVEPAAGSPHPTTRPVMVCDLPA